MLYSKPVTSDDDILDYIPTQYVAEYAKHLGYDGIIFRSSLAPELDVHTASSHKDFDRYNIVVFNYEKCSAIKSNVVEVNRNYFEFNEIDDDSKKLDLSTIS